MPIYMVLPQSFYDRSTLRIAQELLGCFLVRRTGGRERSLRIVETEAYKGFVDSASHASRGKTDRNAVMFGPPGYIYVYLVYGMHYMLNIVTEKEGYPAAVLLRAGEPEEGKDKQIASGPGKLAKYLEAGMEDKAASVFSAKGSLFIKGRNRKGKKPVIVKTTRIGVDYAGQCKHRKWRFYLKDSPAVSKK